MKKKPYLFFCLLFVLFSIGDCHDSSHFPGLCLENGAPSGVTDGEPDFGFRVRQSSVDNGGKAPTSIKGMESSAAKKPNRKLLCTVWIDSVSLLDIEALKRMNVHIVFIHHYRTDDSVSVLENRGYRVDAVIPCSMIPVLRKKNYLVTEIPSRQKR